MRKYITTIGVFDGVHIGHQALFRYMKSFYEKYKLPLKAYVVPYPFEYFLGNFDGLITSLKTRIGEILKYVDEVEILDLARIKDLTPEEFFKEYIADETSVLVVGKDFKFGRNASGTVEDLRKLCTVSSIEFAPFDLVENSGIGKVSSSHIRQLIKLGQIEEVTRLLGRNLALELLVVKELTDGKSFEVTQVGETVKLSLGVYSIAVDETEQKGTLVVGDIMTLNFDGLLLPKSLFSVKILARVNDTLAGTN